jgi:hypothetical protein
MSQHVMYRRQPVAPQAAQNLQAMTLPAPTRGLILSENFAFMQPGAAVVLDNWYPTMQGVRLRGGVIRHCDLHALDATVPPIGSELRLPVISAFEYISGTNQKMFAAQTTKLFDVTANAPVLVKSGQTSGNYCAAQLANAQGDWLMVVNDAGDHVLRFDGTTWVDAQTTGTNPIVGVPAAGFSHVWKYRNRLYFIERNSMNAYFLGLNAVGGDLTLNKIPLSGAATKGGRLLWGASWSLDAGDGIDDKNVFGTSEGEVLIWTGTDPGQAANWRQEGRYQLDKPMGMNAHISLGGDLLIATTDGLQPVSAAITKDAEQLDLASLSRNIRSMWRQEAIEKRDRPWTMKRWDEMGVLLVTWPYGKQNNRLCAVINTGTGAWCRFPGVDATCFIRRLGDCFYGTQDGTIMQMERGGFQDGLPYTATLVGGWGVFQRQSNTSVWHQARATFISANAQPFIPQLSACTDYVINLPQPPPAGPAPALAHVWDEGKWDQMLWDGSPRSKPPVRNTLWRSIGRTGYSHAPVVQVTIAQDALPDVELVAIDCAFERAGVNV